MRVTLSRGRYRSRYDCEESFLSSTYRENARQ